MKVKEIDMAANMAWSPASVNPIMMAAGTAAQQVNSPCSLGRYFKTFHGGNR
jgi:protein transport protein SEC31